MIKLKTITTSLLTFCAFSILSITPLTEKAQADEPSVVVESSSAQSLNTQPNGTDIAQTGTTNNANRHQEHARKEPETLEVSTVAPVRNKTLSFKDLAYSSSIRLQGSGSRAYVGFGSRLDEIVTQANLDFKFTPSPALVALVSHIRVYFNNELMGVVAIEDGSQGKKVSASLELDPRLFSNYNQLRFELIGSIESSCQDPNDLSIWAELSQASALHLTVQKTKLKNELNILPAPFFDERDLDDVTVPMVIAQGADLTEVRAAGIVSSYFGALAQWRPTDFPIYEDKAPKQHSVVFVTNQHKPEFLKDLPDATGPSIQMMSHPDDPFTKLLVISGRDSDDLIVAAKGLAFGQHLLTGPSAKVNHVAQISKRQPYDAPNWIATDKPVTFSELVKDNNSLQVEGLTPPPISVKFRLPPDLFTWQSRGIPLDLAYRYSPPQVNASGSSMSLSVNNGFVKTFNLTKEGHSSESSRLRLPLIDDSFSSAVDTMRIPAFKVDSQNELKFEFGFTQIAPKVDGGDPACRVSMPNKQYAAIDPSSTLDFSNFSHYIEMPNLKTFAKAGYPFTRMADLSETIVVLPDHPNVGQLQAFTNAMGFLGAQTGYPGINVELTDQWNTENLANKDILTIGVRHQLQQVNNEEQAKDLLKQTQVYDSERSLNIPAKNSNDRDNKLVDPDDKAAVVRENVSISARGTFAAITSEESPFTANRTQVNLLANTQDGLDLIHHSLQDSGKTDVMFGSAIAISQSGVSSYQVGDNYYIGELPLLDLIWYHFSKYPMLMALIALLTVILTTVVLWRVLRKIARRRVEIED